MTSKIRQYFYLFSGLVAAIIPIATAASLLTQDQAASALQLVTIIGGAIGAAGAGTAGVIVSKQRSDGTLDASAVDRAISVIPQVVQAAADASADVDRLRQAANDALGTIPVFGPAAQQIIAGLPRF